MDPTIIVALIGVVQTFVGLYFTYRMRELERNTNSIKDELVRVTRSSAHAAGILEEKGRQHSAAKKDDATTDR